MTKLFECLCCEDSGLICECGKPWFKPDGSTCCGPGDDCPMCKPDRDKPFKLIFASVDEAPVG